MAVREASERKAPRFFLAKYKLLRHLAKEGMSTLYVAEHTETGGTHVLKVLPPSKVEASDASYLPRFFREARLASQLNHPNVICIFDILACRMSSRLFILCLWSGLKVRIF